MSYPSSSSPIACATNSPLQPRMRDVSLRFYIAVLSSPVLHCLHVVFVFMCLCYVSICLLTVISLVNSVVFKMCYRNKTELNWIQQNVTGETRFNLEVNL